MGMPFYTDAIRSNAYGDMQAIYDGLAHVILLSRMGLMRGQFLYLATSVCVGHESQWPLCIQGSNIQHCM